MKLNAKILGLAAAASVILWYVVSTLFLVIMPAGMMQSLMNMLPMNMASFFVVNTILMFCSTFLIVFTAAQLHNRFEKR